MISRRRLREILDYDPTIGIFTWKIKPRGQTPVGTVAGAIGSHGYRQIVADGGRYLAHRLAWFYVTGKWPTRLIDHQNMDRLDNRFANLRETGRSGNAANSRAHKDSITGLKGAHPCRGRFKAEICQGGRNRHLGVFDTPEEAHAAYLEAARETFGSFARGS